MSFNEHKKNFNNRWNITSSDSYEEAFCKFKQRILNVFQSIDKKITEESVFLFCQYYGIQKKLFASTIRDRLKEENNEIEFYRLIEVILLLNIEHDYDEQEKLLFIRAVTETIKMSDVNVTIKQTKNGVILYPKGEEKLDEELINKTLLFLNKESNKHFEEALKFCQSRKSVKSAESLRRSLEEFLRYIMESESGLTENIKNLQKKLKKDSTSETRNIIFTVFNHLDEYFNEHSKHGDRNINESENEFLIYQTGLLMRYINKVGKFNK